MSVIIKKFFEDYKIIPAETSVIFKDNMDRPIHRWFLYAEGFSNEFVTHYFNKYLISEGHTIYEPFMGSGTVGVCSKLQNINSIGVELNPLMHFIAETKTGFERIDLKIANELINYLIFPDNPTISPPDFLANTKHFLPSIMMEVLKIKEAVWQLPGCLEKSLFKLAFGNILLRCSNAKRVPSFGYKNKTNLSTTLPAELFFKSLDNILEDINLYNATKLGHVKAVNADSRIQHFASDSADIAITSPPYANGIDYVTDYQLEMGWLEFINSEEKKQLRDNMIAYDKTRSFILRNFYSHGEYYIEDNLAKIISQLQLRSSDYWKKDIHLVLLKYFDDMYKVFLNTYNILKKGSRFILVVGDSLFNGVYVPTDILLAIMGEKIGFNLESIELARSRRSGQNRSFKLRETIITLKKV